MADVTIYGFALSTYVRTCRMACVEKGVSYDLDEMAPHSPEILALNPIGTVPAFRHGDLLLHETSAITRYIDENFDGPRLQPQDVATRARMNEWMSMIQDSFYRVMIREIVLPRFGIIEASDEALQASAEQLNKQFGILDAGLQNATYFAGDALTLADLYLPPILFWLEKTPEGQSALPNYGALGRWYQMIGARESFQATIPPMPSS